MCRRKLPNLGFPSDGQKRFRGNARRCPNGTKSPCHLRLHTQFFRPSLTELGHPSVVGTGLMNPWVVLDAARQLALHRAWLSASPFGQQAPRRSTASTINLFVRLNIRPRRSQPNHFNCRTALAYAQSTRNARGAISNEEDKSERTARVDNE